MKTNGVVCLVALAFLFAIPSAVCARQEIIFVDPATLTTGEEPNQTLASGPGGYEYHFEVDEAQSELAVTVEIVMPFFGAQTDSDLTRVRGWIDGTLDSGEAAFSTIHLTDMDLELSEEISLSYSWFLLGEGWAQGSQMGVSMYQAGPVSSVVDCSFLQPNNLISARGMLQYNMPVIGEDQLDISTLGYVQSDIEGCVWQDGTTITLQSEIDMEYPLEVEGFGQVGTAWLQGTVVAKAEVFWGRADLNDDGFVDFMDFGVFASAWLAAEGDAHYSQACDISDPADGYIDELDLAVLGRNWLEGLDRSFILNPNSEQDAAWE